MYMRISCLTIGLLPIFIEAIETDAKTSIDSALVSLENTVTLITEMDVYQTEKISNKLEKPLKIKVVHIPPGKLIK